MSVSDQVSVCLPAKHESLARVRSELTSALAGAGWTSEPISRVLVAVGEAVTNAVEHGSEGVATVQLEAIVEGDHATVKVSDDGCTGHACPESIPSPPPVSSLRGRGLVMIHALADDVKIRRRGTGTEIRLRFHRTAA
jgi:anti-sigma regulatory factor (Ser/Thr protein kinase)